MKMFLIPLQIYLKDMNRESSMAVRNTFLLKNIQLACKKKKKKRPSQQFFTDIYDELLNVVNPDRYNLI